jgi:hypothetical protein
VAPPTVNQTFVVQASPDGVQPQLVAAAGANGYQLAGETYGGFGLRRRRIPVWAIVFAIFFFPFGLLFLLVKTEDVVTVALERVSGGTQVSIHGRASAGLQRAFQAALGSWQVVGAPAPRWHTPAAGMPPPPPPGSGTLPPPSRPPPLSADQSAVIREAAVVRPEAVADTPPTGFEAIPSGPVAESEPASTAAIREDPPAPPAAPPPPGAWTPPIAPAPPTGLAPPMGGPPGGMPPMPLGPIGGPPGGAPPPLAAPPGGLGPLDLPDAPKLDLDPPPR